MLVRAAAVCVLGVVASLAVGCSSAPSKAPLHPQATTIDFYDAHHRLVGACSGTLLSSNVVLTAAHCADGSSSARVVATYGRGQTSSVARVLHFDWQPGAATHAMQNDLALLVLRTPIALSKYAAIQAESCDGCSVVHVGRVQGDRVAERAISLGSTVRLAMGSPAGHPFSLYTATAPSAGAGPVVRVGGTGDGLVVGVMIGAGGSSHGGYVARLDRVDVQSWIAGVVRSVRPRATSGTSATHTMDDPSATGDTSSSSSSGGASAGDPGNSGDPVVSGGSSGDPSSDPSSSSGSSAGDPTSDPPPPPSANEDVSQTDTTPTDPATAADGFKGDPNASPSPPSEGNADSPPESYGLSVRILDGTETLPPTSTANSWSNLEMNDPARPRTDEYAEMHTDAFVLIGHGAADGYTQITPDPATLDRAAQAGTIVVASCFGADDGGGARTAVTASIAQQANVSPDSVLGCTNIIYALGGGNLGCAGSWQTAAGNPVSSAQSSQLGLKTCTVGQMNPNGLWSNYTCN